MSDIKPFLARPSELYKASFIDATIEYIAEKRDISWHPKILDQRFDEYLQVLYEKETDPADGFVPSTVFWLIVNGDTYVGETDVRHHLTSTLRQYGGHIGYKVRPTMRRLGYGTIICQLAILEARKMGITDILITCDDDNIGSQKIIEANGGILQDKVDNGRGVLTRRYWIYDQNKD